MNRRPFWILPIIIVSQFAGTSLWFASNAVLGDLQLQWALGSDSLGYMTSAVQLGFISGTLCFAFFAISDRFSPRIVFFVCSILGAISNLCIYLSADGLGSLLAFRFLTGFFLAGIYPVGMKIAAGWYQRGLGQALGFLVGALVVGTAFPHLLKGLGQSVSWEQVILSISVVSVAGGVLILLLVPDGPHLFQGTKFSRNTLILIFQSEDLRSASFGYFGHMWELYTMWAFVPIALAAYGAKNSEVINVSLWSFSIIAVGSFGCIGGGLLSKKTGSALVAFFQLASSAVCCVLSPFMFYAPTALFLGFLIFWGIVVVGDSPQFSALTARTAPQEFVGSALTIVNCIGFFITIISIQFTNYVLNFLNPQHIFLFLTVGPIFGLISLRPLLQPDKRERQGAFKNDEL